MKKQTGLKFFYKLIKQIISNYKHINDSNKINCRSKLLLTCVSFWKILVGTKTFRKWGGNEQIYKSIKQIEIVKAHKSLCIIANVIKLCQKRALNSE